MSHENYYVSRKHTGLGMFLNQDNSSSWEGSAQDYQPTVSDNNLHICQYCDQAFPSKTVLNEHVTSIHQVSSEDYNSQSFYCEVCDIDCTSENQYEAHVNGKNHFKRLKLQGKVHINTLGLVSAQTRPDF